MFVVLLIRLNDSFTACTTPPLLGAILGYHSLLFENCSISDTHKQKYTVSYCLLSGSILRYYRAYSGYVFLYVLRNSEYILVIFCAELLGIIPMVTNKTVMLCYHLSGALQSF